MAVEIQSAYNGEVLTRLLIRATTGNELVSRGLIRLEPNVEKEFYLPRLKTGKMLQKRKEQPEDKDSKGNFSYDERVLEPKGFMAFTTFNPRSFESIWKPWQPKGELVFRELPTHVQNELLAELGKVVDFELGEHFITGKYGPGEDEFFDGILTRIVADAEVIRVTPFCGSMKQKLRAIYRKLPKAVRKSPNVRFLMSTEDWDKYDDELTDQSNKGSDTTSTNPKRFKNIPIEDLAAWPEGVIVATVCGRDLQTNLWAAVGMVNDFEAVKIDRLTNSGERYFFKMLMKVDTNIAFGEQVVLYDERDFFAADPKELSFSAAGETKEVAVAACCEYGVSGKVPGFTYEKTDTGLSITATENTGKARSGKFVLKLKNDTKQVIEIAVSQEAKAAEVAGGEDGDEQPGA